MYVEGRASAQTRERITTRLYTQSYHNCFIVTLVILIASAWFRAKHTQSRSIPTPMTTHITSNNNHSNHCTYKSQNRFPSPDSELNVLDPDSFPLWQPPISSAATTIQIIVPTSSEIDSYQNHCGFNITKLHINKVEPHYKTDLSLQRLSRSLFISKKNHWVYRRACLWHNKSFFSFNQTRTNSTSSSY